MDEDDRPLPLIGGLGGAPITSVETWRTHGAPKGGDRHWVDGRSAKELANAWCRGSQPGIPSDFADLLDSHPLLSGLQLTAGYAEHKTPLRGERGGPRVHDLLLVGATPRDRVVVGLEAKADETFDRTLGERWRAAEATPASGKRTNWPRRLSRLSLALLGIDAVTGSGELDERVADVPYQLFSALAGTLIEAEKRGATLAVLAVHVFATASTLREIVAANKAHLAAFVERVTGVSADQVRDGQLYGPFTVPGGGGIPSVPTLIGSVTTEEPDAR